MAIEWPIAIVRMITAKEALHKADVQGLWPWKFPGVAASEQEIAQAESVLGLQIDHNYRNFLHFANGWEGFFQNIDLFSCSDLIGGLRKERAEELISFVETSVLASSAVNCSSLLPIGVSKTEIDVFCIKCNSGAEDGVVIWFAGTEVQRFPDFCEFFLAMIEYNLREIAALE